MEVRFWGTRGSLPASIKTEHIREKVEKVLEIAIKKGLGPDSDINAFIDNELPFWLKGTYGTNTPCVEIRDGDEFVLCDGGTGLRDFSNQLPLIYGDHLPKEFHIVISHLHWDHIHGFPFFSPGFTKGTRINIYGGHNNIRKAFSIQQGPPFFPLNFNDLKAEYRFFHLTSGKTYDIGGFKVTIKEQTHPGKSYGYRFEKNGKSVVYSTDSEHKSYNDNNSTSFTRFFSQADLLIFDAQYTLVDAATIKENWGHSNNLIGVELAQKAEAKHLCLFHQDPSSTDEDLDKFLRDTRKLAYLLKEDGQLKVSIASDGMVIKV